MQTSRSVRTTPKGGHGLCRDLAKRWLPAAACALALTLSAPRITTAATITVAGDCTLVDAITAANTDAPAGSCAAGAGADEIHLTADVVLTGTNNTQDGPNGLPSVVSSVTLLGNGFTVERQEGTGQFRILHVGGGGVLEIIDARVENGFGFPHGGGIYVSGSLTLTGSAVSGNTALQLGGGIFARGEVLVREASLVSGNSAGDGGGVATAKGGGELTIVDSTVSDNLANASGGGILMQAGSDGVTIHNSTLTGNAAVLGGGLAVLTGSTAVGSLTVSSSTFAGNTALDRGGAVLSSIANLQATFVNSTLSGNSAVTQGGAIYVKKGAFELSHTTLSGNSAAAGGGIFSSGPEADTLLVGTIVADSVSGGDCGGTAIQDGGNNFDDDGSCPGTSPITPGVDYDPALADNGGPTQTHALLPASSAIDAAGECGLALDQRSFLRDGLCDSGAFELGAVEPMAGVMTGLDGRRARCDNLTTGLSVGFVLGGAKTWDCTAAGLIAAPGDEVQQRFFGIAQSSATAGGSVTGQSAAEVVCWNITTGQQLLFVPGGTSWNCADQLASVSPGDLIVQRVTGFAP
jgi:predicted outer membrane repeat protein